MNQTPIWQPPRRRTFWARLSPFQRVGLIGAAVLLPCCGGLAAIGALSGSPKTYTTTDVPVAEQVAGTPDALLEPSSDAANPDATGAPKATEATPAPTAGTVPASNPGRATTKTVTVTTAIAFATRTVDDDSLAKGKTKVRTKGVAGVRTLTYRVTLTGGKETGRKLISDAVTKKPVTKVVAVGTKAAAANDGCDPHYDPCVPIASDVDCAGGSGNGPAYVDGPIRVIGDDPYDLDRDGDGIACDR
ncbi:G5 domain-containing protein [Paractinoplanes durhamensis]|uniref:G5 domain-containing protein n=1 Tax=Paractinoplanes durhamensis TaxID=113563 RepID=A0ABQ3YT32_9ACTN|nr:G5 domain-containing protein [Actinoplanes durhamensis]GIE00735.1 hypothetical protein Adu01nite_20850 [Actinoplanes durhamensis]